MTNTTNKIKRKKGRKQIRLSDLYRYMVTGIVSNIRGIEDYHATEGRISVEYTKVPGISTYHTDNELDRLEAIKKINKFLSEV